MRLSGKNILLGITGSISAYKSADLCRLLVKEGATVRVVMTPSATEFISPLTLSTLSKNTVFHTMVSEDETWNNHVELGLWADLLLIAPASANTIAHFATGICESLLDAVYLSARCPVMMAPAMDHDMFLHASTQDNLSVLKTRGHQIVGPAQGELASGLIGEGRLVEPADIVTEVVDFLYADLPLRGKKIIVTAGPTREAIDPVRYISNHSTGKMGIAIANELVANGANVILVLGPVAIDVPRGVSVIPVSSASEMYKSVMDNFEDAAGAVLTAAVADYTPEVTSSRKIKKSDNDMNLALVKTKDIAASVGQIKKADQFLVGFALETNDEINNAKNKLKSKNLDLIILNSLNDEGAGFGTDTNKITFISNTETTELPLKLKSDLAKDIVKKIKELVHA
ncbi:MAG: bifunctional phosphopantothenoylcysteine decarboxylase/phosphopantothenate--cysteine ligase CoaBC [Bacteroidota bacterium]|jgi:phosphopantothenoylcysteine decarboxylase/phosphopantothenate--cysteine ligase